MTYTCLGKGTRAYDGSLGIGFLGTAGSTGRASAERLVPLAGLVYCFLARFWNACSRAVAFQVTTDILNGCSCIDVGCSDITYPLWRV
jgi:hypothetical protein